VNVPLGQADELGLALEAQHAEAAAEKLTHVLVGAKADQIGAQKPAEQLFAKRQLRNASADGKGTCMKTPIGHSTPRCLKSSGTSASGRDRAT
jgi:hypothetical protein